MIPYLDLLQAARPEIIVVLASVAVLAVDLLALPKASLKMRWNVAVLLGGIGCIAAIRALGTAIAPADGFGGAFVATPLAHVLQVILLAMTVLVLLLCVDSDFTEHVSEFVLLVLLATVGMIFLVATQDILVIFLSLELLSLSLYILSALDKRSARAAEAALKYFLFGGMSAAFLLFGLSLLYGMTHTTNLPAMAIALDGQPVSPLLVVALIMVLVGFGFKVAAAPLHFWAPDVYEAAPVPAAAFVASSSKIASFYLLFAFLALGLRGVQGFAGWGLMVRGWAPVVACAATLSMVLGNLAALRQKNLRRLVAYSAVAHAGYMLVAVVALTRESLAAMLYYVVTYALATLGIFAVAGVVERTAGDSLESLDGLSRRAPVPSACLFVFVLSLAGIPPLAGFFGKFYLFGIALRDSPGLLWLVVLAIAMSAVSLYYYLQVLKRVYVLDAPEGAQPVKVAPVSQLVMVMLAIGVVVLGCAPHLLLHYFLMALGL